MVKQNLWRGIRQILPTAQFLSLGIPGSLFLFGLFLAACSGPRSLPPGPTPIPTLIPATEPASTIGLMTPTAIKIQSYPARSPSAGLGQVIYQSHCASCHGADGKGVVPGARNFADLDYMRGETPVDFYVAITEGRREMLSFRDILTSDERWDVAFYVWRFSTNAETLALGQQIYLTNCAACHGVDGIGTVLGAADFTDLRLVGNRAPRDFYLTVTQGKGSMPAWQGRLSQDERWAVIDYLNTFTYSPVLPEEISLILPTVIPEKAVCDQAYLSQKNPFAWDEAETIASGKTTYDQVCAACHAVDGSGALPGVTDLSIAEIQSALRTNSGEFLCIVAEGKGTMPGWKNTLSLDQIWQVLTFIANLKQ